MTTFSESLFLKVPVVGILRGYHKEQVLKIVEIYEAVGYTNVEITMNTPDVLGIIAAVAQQFSGRLNIGAGTITTLEEVDLAHKAGAQFMVSPVVDERVITHCVKKGLPIFPGAYSPTEIFNAAKAGARMVKVFPASTLGPKYIKDVLAPLNDLELMPTGGVTTANVPEYLKAGAKAFGMGGFLFNDALIEKEDWEGLERHLKEFKRLFP